MVANKNGWIQTRGLFKGKERWKWENGAVVLWFVVG